MPCRSTVGLTAVARQLSEEDPKNANLTCQRDVSTLLCVHGHEWKQWPPFTHSGQCLLHVVLLEHFNESNRTTRYRVKTCPDRDLMSVNCC